MPISILDILGTIAGAENELRKAREEAKTKKAKESIDNAIELLKAKFMPFTPTTTPTQTAGQFLGGAQRIQPTLPNMKPLTPMGLNQSFLPRVGAGEDIIPGLGARPAQLPSLKAPQMGAIPEGTITMPQSIGGTSFWTPPKEKATASEKLASAFDVLKEFDVVPQGTKDSMSADIVEKGLFEPGTYLRRKELGLELMKQAKPIAIKQAGIVKPKGVPAGQLGYYTMAKTALGDYEALRTMSKDDIRLAYGKLPTDATSKINTMLYAATDAWLRIQTGAQANPSEIKKEMQKYQPRPWDSDKAIDFKLKALYGRLEAYKNELEKFGGIQPAKPAIQQPKQQTKQQIKGVTVEW